MSGVGPASRQSLTGGDSIVATIIPWVLTLTNNRHAQHVPRLLL